MNVNPMANVFSSTSCKASVYPGDWSSRSERKGEAMSARIRRTPLVPSRQTHERAVHAPAKEQLDRRFDACEKREHAVIRLGQVPDVKRKKQEVQGLDGDIAGAVDRQVLRELADLLKQRFSASGT